MTTLFGSDPVYQSSPIADLYRKHGFTIYGTSRTHYLMSYNIEDASSLGDYKKWICPSKVLNHRYEQV